MSEISPTAPAAPYQWVAKLLGTVLVLAVGLLATAVWLVMWGALGGMAAAGLVMVALWSVWPARPAPGGVRRARRWVSVVLASWLLAFAVAPSVVSSFHLNPSVQPAVAIGIALLVKLIYAVGWA
jgi:hypothetical protein